MLIKDPPVEITGNLVMLGTNEYPLYLFKGERSAALFEGGVSAMGALVLQQMQRLGIGSNFVTQVVVTHAHPDHVMAIPLFRNAFPKARILASHVAAKTLAAEKAISFFCKIDAVLTDSLAKAGRIGNEHRAQPMLERQIRVDQVIKDGDTVRIDGSASFIVLETPGHSECSLSFHEPTRRILIISDASGYYIAERNYWWPNYFSNYGEYLSSIESLAQLSADVLCLSHNAVVKGADDVHSYLRGAIAATEQYHKRIIQEAKAGRTPQQIADRLGAEVHEKTQLLPLDFFQKNCAILVKQSLAHEGIALEK